MGRSGVAHTWFGEAKLFGDGGAEYSCVRCFRHRRLITFLYLQGFEGSFRSMTLESDAIFSVMLLKDLVVRGQWCDALRYLSRFLPVDVKLPVKTIEADVLRRFLLMHSTLANIVAGTTKPGEQVAALVNKYFSHEKTVCHGTVRLRSIFLNILYAQQHVRASLDWERVRRKASEIVDAWFTGLQGSKTWHCCRAAQ